MKSNIKKLPESQIEIEVTLEPKEFIVYFERATEEARTKVHLKGFRPGTAPKEVADRYLDKDEIFEKAASSAVRSKLKELSDEHGWTVIETPKIEILEPEKGNELGLRFKGSFAILPEVKLGDYKKIAKKVLAEKKTIEVKKEEIEKTMTWLRESRSTQTLVEREAKKGDIIEIDLESKVGEELLEGAQFKNERFLLGESRFIPGFDEHLVAMKAGETKTFVIKAPADYWNESIRGKEISFKATVHGVYERVLPELNDAFAQTLGTELKTVADIEKNIKEGLTLEAEEKERERLRLKLLDEITKESTMEIPKIMIEKTVDNMAADFMSWQKRAGKEAEPVTDEVRKGLTPKAIKSIQSNLVIHEMAKAENLTPTPEEVAEEAKREYGDGGKIDPRTAYDYSYGVVQNKKVFEFLEKLI